MPRPRKTSRSAAAPGGSLRVESVVPSPSRRAGPRRLKRPCQVVGCTMPAMRSETFCINHHPAQQEKMHAARRRGGQGAHAAEPGLADADLPTDHTWGPATLMLSATMLRRALTGQLSRRKLAPSITLLRLQLELYGPPLGQQAQLAAKEAEFRRHHQALAQVLMRTLGAAVTPARAIPPRPLLFDHGLVCRYQPGPPNALSEFYDRGCAVGLHQAMKEYMQKMVEDHTAKVRDERKQARAAVQQARLAGKQARDEKGSFLAL